jgi:hypothetical protein
MLTHQCGGGSGRVMVVEVVEVEVVVVVVLLVVVIRHRHGSHTRRLVVICKCWIISSMGSSTGMGSWISQHNKKFCSYCSSYLLVCKALVLRWPNVNQFRRLHITGFD